MLENKIVYPFTQIGSTVIYLKPTFYRIQMIYIYMVNYMILNLVITLSIHEKKNE